MHHTVGMFGRRVNREQLHNDTAGVDEVVFGMRTVMVSSLISNGVTSMTTSKK